MSTPRERYLRGMGRAYQESDVRLGRSIALMGESGGKYPSGNSLLVKGSEEAVLIDPSLSLHQRGGPPEGIDRVFVSHAHEDHMVGLGNYDGASVHVHAEDLLGVHSIEGFMKVYGMPPAIAKDWQREVIDRFHYQPRPDATGFVDGQRFDLGALAIEVVHLPGHTRGHSGFIIEPDGVFFVADVDLSSFGPYYGDHWSDLEDFERALQRCREIDAKHYVTFHHKGVVSGRSEFLAALDQFAAVIGRREARLLAFLAEPRTLAEMVAHRIVYKPGTALLFLDHVEQTSIEMHLTRLVREGAVVECEPDRFRIAS